MNWSMTVPRSTGSKTVASVALVAVLYAVPWFVPAFYVFLTSRLLVFALFAMALNLVFGYGGLPSLGHAAFFGTGGYVVALGVTRWDWSFWTILAVVVLLGLVLGAILGLLTIRTEGIYLLLLSLAFAQSLWALAFEQVRFTRGDNGISGISRQSIPFGLGGDFYSVILFTTVLFIGVMWVWTRSPAGRAVVGARESKSRMEALGYRVWQYRVGAFALSGMISSIAGMLLVYLQGIASPEILFWPLSADVLVMCIIGSAGVFLGPALGASLVIGLQSLVSTYTDRWVLVLGVLYILTMLFLRDGLLGRLGVGTAGDDPDPSDEPTEATTDAAAVPAGAQDGGAA